MRVDYTFYEPLSRLFQYTILSTYFLNFPIPIRSFVDFLDSGRVRSLLPHLALWGSAQSSASLVQITSKYYYLLFWLFVFRFPPSLSLFIFLLFYCVETQILIMLICSVSWDLRFMAASRLRCNYKQHPSMVYYTRCATPSTLHSLSLWSTDQGVCPSKKALIV